MAYTEIDDPSAYFQTALFTGTGGSHSITNTGNSDLQPDWVWVKSRSFVADHELFDSVRGTGVALISNGNYAESSGRGVNSFDSDGFSIVNAQAATNTSGETYAAWQWKAGTSFTNDASGTGIGTIDSAGSVSTAAGFSVISYTGNGSAGATVAHGLGSTPKMIIVKRRNASSSWKVYHASVGANYAGYLNTTGIFDEEIYPWNNTSPTSSVFSLGTTPETNGSGATLIAYCFADVQGYSKFGSYIGNGNADGKFVYTGFKPAFVMIKSSSNSGQAWVMQDNKRDGFNYNNHRLFANSSGAEESTVRMDLLSNGFKCRDNDGNGNGFTYIYMAFASSPFTTSSGVPTTAR